MMVSKPGLKLLDALRELRETRRELAQAIQQPVFLEKGMLERLQEVVNSLGQLKPGKPMRCPEEYVTEWKEYLDGKRTIMEPRALRYLCWEPDVVTNSRFQDYLDTHEVDLSSRSLQGMVRACHARWSPDFASGQIAARVRDRLEKYNGPNRVLSRWREGLSMILGPRGSHEFAFEMTESRRPITKHCEHWAVDEQSMYVRDAVRVAVQESRDQIKTKSDAFRYLLDLFSWPRWNVEHFKAEISSTILYLGSNAESEVRESFTRFVLNDTRLGDPRLPKNSKNWLGIIDKAQNLFVQWLSIADIKFFFEHVLPDGNDPHGRKPFWLRYVPQLRKSRPLLGYEDEVRLRRTMSQFESSIGNFGYSTYSSAFLLEFDDIMVVEFSQYGNACYIYKKDVAQRVIPDFWTSRRLDTGRLKQSKICYTRIAHRGGWQQEMEGTLAQCGVRPAWRRPR